tara:strand:+ start:395 stop:655 length:261 start_codon:yes stop_codon:yes gene_type:complete
MRSAIFLRPKLTLNTMIILSSEEKGCVYSIDSEGTLFYTPMYINGTINLGDWIEVESVDELDDESVNEVHDKLIAMSKAIGEYFQK